MPGPRVGSTRADRQASGSPFSPSLSPAPLPPAHSAGLHGAPRRSQVSVATLRFNPPAGPAPPSVSRPLAPSPAPSLPSAPFPLPHYHPPRPPQNSQAHAHLYSGHFHSALRPHPQTTPLCSSSLRGLSCAAPPKGLSSSKSLSTRCLPSPSSALSLVPTKPTVPAPARARTRSPHLSGIGALGPQVACPGSGPAS